MPRAPAVRSRAIRRQKRELGWAARLLVSVLSLSTVLGCAPESRTAGLPTIELVEIGATTLPLAAIVRSAVLDRSGEFIVLLVGGDSLLRTKAGSVSALVVKGMSDPIAAYVSLQSGTIEVLDRDGRLRSVAPDGHAQIVNACAPSFGVESATRSDHGWYLVGSISATSGARRRLAVSRLTNSGGLCSRRVFSPVQAAAGAVSATISAQGDTIRITTMQAPFSTYIVVGDSNQITRGKSFDGPNDTVSARAENKRARWIVLPPLRLDSGWTIRVFSDLRSDHRLFHFMNAQGERRAQLQVEVPIGLLAVDTLSRTLLASRRTDRNELV